MTQAAAASSKKNIYSKTTNATKKPLPPPSQPRILEANLKNINPKPFR